MGYMFRGNPAFQFCLKIVKENWLGDIFEVEADMNHSYGGEPYQEYLGRFKGGIMFNLGCHLIDFVVAMMGAPEHIMPFLKSTPDVSPAIKNNCMTVLEYPYATVILRCCSRGRSRSRFRSAFSHLLWIRRTAGNGSGNLSPSALMCRRNT